MTKWEYMVVHLSSQEGATQLEGRLAAMGAKGWEYAGDLAPTSIHYVLLFKREVN